MSTEIPTTLADHLARLASHKKLCLEHSLPSTHYVDVAKICHEANRAYCASLGDTSQLPWDEAPDWQKESAINGVLFHLRNIDAGPEGSHESWLLQKQKDGWVYGEVKDAEAKTHPCMVAYGELPADQQAKDALFVAIVHALRA